MKTISQGISTRSPAHSFTAGQEAVEHALHQLDGTATFLLIVATPDYNHDEMLRGIYSVADIPAIGFSVSWVFVNNGIHPQNMIVVLAFQVSDVRLFREQGRHKNDRAESQKVGDVFAQHIIADVFPNDRQKPLPLLLTLIDIQLVAHWVMEGISNTLAPLVPMAGGVINKERETGCLFWNDTVTDLSIIGAVIAPRASGVGVAHGWRPTGQSAVATHAADNRIFELNGRPAFEVYREIWHDIFPDITGKTHQETQQEFFQFAPYHPLGLAQMAEEYLLRETYGVLEDGSILCAGGVPENAVLHFMQGDPGTLSLAADASSQQAIERLNGHSPDALLCFECVSRFTLSGYNVLDELQHMTTKIGKDVPVLGLPSWGEIANSTKGVTELQNKAVVTVAFSN